MHTFRWDDARQMYVVGFMPHGGGWEHMIAQFTREDVQKAADLVSYLNGGNQTKLTPLDDSNTFTVDTQQTDAEFLASVTGAAAAPAAPAPGGTTP